MALRFTPIALLFFFTTYGQTIVRTTPLPNAINETSGLANYKGQLVTHNDSGGKARLFLFDTLGKNLSHRTIEGAINKDWEDLTQDEDYFYIADTGNNFGNRKDLRIFRVAPTDSTFQLKGTTTIRYGEQKRFNKRSKHPFDAEALANADTTLLLFSKNRAAFTTEVYCIPKVLGDYELYPSASVFVDALITGADYDSKEKLLLLVGYNFEGQQFFYTVPNFDVHTLSFAQMEKHLLPLKKAQIEAVKIIDPHSAWLTTEQEGKGAPLLFKIEF
jgi:hypothetical protein